ncbi:hypothetical protein BH18THE2_BH18THE2_21640 [soil metagenome]
MYLTYIQTRIALLTGVIGMHLILFAATFTTSPIQAETGKGEDIFKVIMTIFGIDKSKGDVIAIVTANNGEASRVKFLDSEAPYVVPLNSTAGDSHLVEYVATFPNVTVNAGDGYKACVLTTKNLDLICNTGLNSPASRPEFVDISLNATTNSDDGPVEEGEESTGGDEE